MATEDEAGVLFEINDFTNASPWETFISAIEDILQQWRLATSNVDHSVTMQHNKTERVTYAGRNFSLNLFVTGERWEPSNQQPMNQWPPAMQQLINCSEAFPVNVHHITRWYGISSFIILSPVTDSDVLTSEAQAKLILSSVAIAIKNTGCNVPMFVQLKERWRQLYHGWCEAGSMQCTFEMVHLKHTPTQLGHLAGILDLFKGKLFCWSPQQPVQLAIRYTYIIKHWQTTSNFLSDLSPSNNSPSTSSTDMTTIPLGSKHDPLLEIHISAVWPQLSEHLVIDNAHYSQLNPMEAPMWSVVSKLCDASHCELATRLDGILKLCYYQETMAEILGEATNKSSQEFTTVDGVTKALLKITESQFEAHVSTPLIKSIRQQSSSRSHGGHMIDDDITEHIIEHLFPAVYKYDRDIDDDCDNTTERITTAPAGSFTYHLACCLANTAIIGVSAVAEVWQEVTTELRHCWEATQFIPRISQGDVPNLQSCLLHQKLQMLNCCIKHKMSTVLPRQQHQCCDSDSNSDDEFFEAQEMLNDLTNKDHVSSDRKLLTWDDREGVSHQYNDLILIATGEPLCVPITQEVAPRTEDMLVEQENILARLGTGEEAGRVRAKMQSASLLSDMQAFKAANPSCLLEDFVRWYSPRDWILQDDVIITSSCDQSSHDDVTITSSCDQSSHENSTTEVVSNNSSDVTSSATINNSSAIDNSGSGDITETVTNIGWDEDWAEIEEDVMLTATGPSAVHRFVHGELSPRMKQPDNTWIQAWEIAEAVPVQRQKQLFDHTTEAEKVLHYLESLRPVDLSLQLLPVLIVISINQISSRMNEQLQQCTAKCVKNLLSDCMHFMSTLPHQLSLDELPKLQECVRLLGQAEHLLAAALSINSKLLHAVEMVGTPITPAAENEIRIATVQLLETPELVVDNSTSSAVCDALRGLFTAEAASNAMAIDEVDIELSDGTSKQQQKEIPPEAGREFLLWNTIPSPTHHSLLCPQRLFCILTPDEFRLAGAFTTDTNVM